MTRRADRLARLEAVALYQPHARTKGERDASVKSYLDDLTARKDAGEDIRAEIEAQIAADPDSERARAVFDALGLL